MTIEIKAPHSEAPEVWEDTDRLRPTDLARILGYTVNTVTRAGFKVDAFQTPRMNETVLWCNMGDVPAVVSALQESKSPNRHLNGVDTTAEQFSFTRPDNAQVTYRRPQRR